jgi:hypothetical protein
MDQLNFCSTQEAQRVAFKVISVLQDEPAGKQVAGAALLFLMLCERFNQKPRDVLNKSARMLYDAFSEGTGEHAKAIQTYLLKELS